MATKAIAKNTGRIRFFIDDIAAGIARDVNGDVAVFRAFGSDFIDIQTGEVYAGPTYWTPAYDTNLIGWWDPSDSDNITLSVSGTVAQIDDLSSSGNHFVQSVIAEQGDYAVGPAQIGGLDTVYFDSGNKHLYVDGTSLADKGNNFTIGCVFNGSPAIAQGGTGRWDVVNAFINTTVDGFDFWDSALGGTGIFTVSFDLDGLAQINGYDDGTLGAQIDPFTTSSNDGTFYLNRLGNDLASAVCVYGEVFITNAVDTATRQKYEGYIAHKWGQTGVLPSDHPYKTSPPTV